ncbi:exodeoxyribonuclease VII large subunit [compost metagenome]
MRGYAVIRDGNDKPVSRAASLAPNAHVAIEFADGRVAAMTGEGGSIAPPPGPAPARPTQPVRPARKSEPPAGQGSLF